MTDQKKDDEPKIIVDDWKEQAQKEKQRLAEETQTKAAEQPPGRDAGGRELPPADFTTLVNSLAAQALLAIGGMQDPKTKRRYVDLALAKHHIDTLSVLEAKTTGNLTEEETKLLNNALYEVRMQYVQVAQAVTSGPQPDPQ